ncbi:hypothetical protein ACFLTH_13675 [Bacteroidota bacterium]
MAEEAKQEIDENIELKVFPEPTKEEANSYIDKKKHFSIIITFAAAFTVWIAICIFAGTAFFMTGKYTLTNIGIILVLITVAIFLGYKLITSISTGYEPMKAIVSSVSNVTPNYESESPEERGKKVKLEFTYEYTDKNESIKKSGFVLLFDREKLEELKPFIPDVGSEIYIIFNEKKQKTVNIFLPKIKEYLYLI